MKVEWRRMKEESSAACYSVETLVECCVFGLRISRFLLLILPRSLLSSLSLLFPDSIATRSFHFWSSTSRSRIFLLFSGTITWAMI